VATTIKRSEHENTSAHRALVERQEREIASVLERQKGELADLDKQQAERRSSGGRYGPRTQGADESRRKLDRKKLVENHQDELKIAKERHAREREATRRRHEREAAK
jgi:hypothetical protein